MSHLKTIISNCGIATSFLLEVSKICKVSELRIVVPIDSLLVMYVKKNLYTTILWRTELRKNGFKLDAQTTNKVISHKLYSKLNEQYEVYCYRRAI